MLCKPAQYLLRIDDLCPTVSPGRWKQLAALIAEFHLRPILAVVPENCDLELDRSPANPEFWAGMRKLQSEGGAIALHGYRHLCASRGRSLAKMARASEFAGVEEATQRLWIREGLRILREHGLHPRLWAAPRHGFDAHTLHILKAEGIEAVSDGLARMPFVREGITWIPQQLWAPRHERQGLWTICIHPNTLSDEEFERLRAFVRGHAARFTSVDRALAEFPPRKLDVGEWVYAKAAWWRIQWRHWRKRWAQIP